MFSAEYWKDVLNRVAPPGRHPVEHEAFIWPLRQAAAEEPAARNEKRKKRDTVKEERKIQKEQQKEWDELNKASFPASDPVARY